MQGACATYPVNASWTQCPDCKKFYDPNDRAGCEHGYGVEIRVICPECAQLLGYRQCTDCGEWAFAHEIADCDGTNYCEVCAEQHEYYRCENCNTWTHAHDLRPGPDSNGYCESCWDENFSHCDGCCEVFYNDDLNFRQDGRYCDGCSHDGREWDAGRFRNSDEYNEITSHRAFGVEIETAECEAYQNLEDNTVWGVKNDGSISGMEFVSPVMAGDSGLAEVRNICDFAEDNGWTADSRCGLHVHFNMGDETAESMQAIACAFHYTYPVWSEFVNCSRKTNRYCGKDRNELAQYLRLDSLCDWTEFSAEYNRYTWINWAAYYVHGSLEVRLHQGTVNGEEICNWIKALAAFIDWAADAGLASVRRQLAGKDSTERFELIARLWREAGCNDLIEYYLARAEAHSADFVDYSEVT